MLVIIIGLVAPQMLRMMVLSFLSFLDYLPTLSGMKIPYYFVKYKFT